MDTGGLREIVVVLVLALAGLLLAATAAFTPWYVGAAQPAVVRLEPPGGPAG